MYRGINNIIRQNCEDKCEIGNSEDSVKLLNIFRSGFLKIKKTWAISLPQLIFSEYSVIFFWKADFDWFSKNGSVPGADSSLGASPQLAASDSRHRSAKSSERSEVHT